MFMLHIFNYLFHIPLLSIHPSHLGEFTPILPATFVTPKLPFKYSSLIPSNVIGSRLYCTTIRALTWIVVTVQKAGHDANTRIQYSRNSVLVTV